MAVTLPGDHTIGDTGHTMDHDTIVNVLQSLQGADTAALGWTGPLVVNNTANTGPGALPVGYGDSQGVTGLQIASSYPSDDVPAGTDGTGRINLYSYQRANTYSFGETIRNTLMRWDAKAMTAWYMPLQGSSGSWTAGYNGSGDVEVGSAFRPITWTGSHYEANDDSSVHAHWEVEIPDVTGALQGRFSIVFGDVTSSAIGLDKTNIATNLADFTFNAHGLDHTGTYQEQYMRISAPPGFERPLEFNINTTLGAVASGTRWRIVSNATSESGSNAGSDLVIKNYSDSGSFLSSALFVQRSDGQIATGNAGALGARIAVAWGTSGIHGFYAKASSTPGSGAAFMSTLTATSDRLLQGIITGDANNRYIIQASGTMLWGGGSGTQDINLYRQSAGLLKTDNSLEVATSLGVGAAPTHVFDVSSSASGELASFVRTSTSDTSAVVAVLAGDTSTAQALGISVSGDGVNRFAIDPTGKTTIGDGTNARDTNIYRSASGTLTTDGILTVGSSLKVTTAGKTLFIKEGTNAKMGTAILAAGAVTVSTTAVTSTSRILLTVQSLGTVTTPTAVAVTARTAGTSFTITSAGATDTSTVAWVMFEPA